MTKLTHSQKVNNTIEGVRDEVLTHTAVMEAAAYVFANEQTFREYCNTYAEVKGCDFEAPGRNKAYKLYREVMAKLTDRAADWPGCLEDRILRGALIERLRLKLEDARQAHQAAYNAWHAAVMDRAGDRAAAKVGAK